MKRMSGLVNSKFPLPGLRKGGCPTLIPLLRFTELVDKQCGAGFSLRGTSVPLGRRAGTRGRRAEAPPQAEARPTFRHSILQTSIILCAICSAARARKPPIHRGGGGAIPPARQASSAQEPMFSRLSRRRLQQTQTCRLFEG